MNETEVQPINVLPSADEFAVQAQHRMYGFVAASGAMALICACLYILVPSLVLPAAAVLVIMGLILLWHYPRMAVFGIFAAVCLIEVLPNVQPDSITERIPFFSNVNTIIQIATGKDFKAIPFNPLEVILVVSATLSFIRAVFQKNMQLRVGPLAAPIGIYCGFVLMGWLNGMMTGGDFKISLMEVRPQVYLLLAYLAAVNVVRERRDVDKLLWTVAICIGIKGILYTFRRYVTMAGQPLPDQGVGSHEEAFMFAAFIVLMVLVTLAGNKRRLALTMWALLPCVILGDLATNRRAGIGALVLGIPLLLMALDRAMPRFRRKVRFLGLFLAISWSIYYPMFQNSTSALGQPAHAIASMFHPDPRDASSNAYRDAENADLMATIRMSPLIGFGYGKRMLHAVPIADISTQYEYWDIMTHNSVFWVWMRLGTLGFFTFWMMIASILVFAGQTLRGKNLDFYTVTAGAYTLLLVSMLLVFGLLDLGLTNFRDMLFVGVWTGTLVAVKNFAPQPSPEGQIENRAENQLEGKSGDLIVS